MKKIQKSTPGLFMLKWEVCSRCCWGMKRAYCSFKPHSIGFAAVKYFWKFTAVGEIPWSFSVSFLPIRELKALRFGLQKWHFSVTRLKCGAVLREHPDRFGTPKKRFSGAKLHSLGNAARHACSCASARTQNIDSKENKKYGSGLCFVDAFQAGALSNI